MKRIIFAVTNDLTYDQRMYKICTSLAESGFDVTLVGFKKKKSLHLEQRKFQQKRLGLFFQSGFLFFAEANARLLFYFLFAKVDVLCANDLDTALPVLFASIIRNKKRVFDAHELFCEMHDIVRKPKLYNFWKRIEKFCQPKFPLGYTENQSYADEYEKMYGVKYFVVMNSPYKTDVERKEAEKENILIYQGVVERGRGFEGLLPALKNLDVRLIVCGNGTFYDEVGRRAAELKVADKIDFEGYILPADLKALTKTAKVGLNMNANLGASFYYSLSNRFFDYMHAGIPQITMNYPENKKIFEQFEIGVLIDDLEPQTICNAANTLLSDDRLYQRLSQNCMQAREVYNWQNEEKKLIAFYKSL